MYDFTAVLIVVAGAVAYLSYRFVRFIKSAGRGGCGCGGGSGGCKPRTGIKFKREV